MALSSKLYFKSLFHSSPSLTFLFLDELDSWIIRIFIPAIPLLYHLQDWSLKVDRFFRFLNPKGYAHKKIYRLTVDGLSLLGI